MRAIKQTAEPVGKSCRECGRDRPIERFAHCKHTPDGRVDRCLDCISAAAQRGRLEREQRRDTRTTENLSATQRGLHARTA